MVILCWSAASTYVAKEEKMQRVIALLVVVLVASLCVGKYDNVHNRQETRQALDMPLEGNNYDTRKYINTLIYVLYITNSYCQIFSTLAVSQPLRLFWPIISFLMLCYILPDFFKSIIPKTTFLSIRPCYLTTNIF